MRRIIIIISFSLPFLALAYWFAKKEGYLNSRSVYELVSPDAYALLQVDRLDQFTDNLFYSKTDSLLLQITSDYRQIRDGLIHVDTTLRNAFSRPLYISVHQTSRDKLGYVIFTPVSRTLSKNLLSQSAQLYPGMTVQQRRYEGRNIYDLKGRINLSATFIGGFLVLSETPFLIEDVIRNLKNSEPVFDESASTSNATIFVNTQKVESLFALLGLKLTDQLPWQKVIRNQGDVIRLNFDFTSNGLLWNGSMPGNIPGSFTERPVWNLVPANSSFVVSQPSIDRWGGYNEDAQAFHRLYDLDIAGLGKLAGASSLVILEPVKSSEIEYLLITQPHDPQLFIDEVERLHQQILADNGDSLYQERFFDYTITEIRHPRISSHLLGDFFRSEDLLYYVQIGKQVVFSDRISSIRQMISDRETERTWARDIKKQRYLDQVMDGWNNMLMINPEVIGNYANIFFNEAWAEFLGKEEVWKPFVLVGYQRAAIGGNTFTNGFAFYEPQRNTVRTSIKPVIRTYFGLKIISPPAALRSNEKGNFIFAFQDTTGQFQLVNTSGDILHTSAPYPLAGTDIISFDYNLDGDDEFIFGAENKVFICNQEGRVIDGFPVALPELSPLRHISVVDYDQSGKYRFFIQTANNKVWLLDKAGVPLQGWKGISMASPLIEPPFHFRIRSMDYMAMVQEDGEVNIRQRNGNPRNGFPVALEGYLETGPFLIRGRNPSESKLAFVTRAGMLTHINLLGEVVYRKQLFRPMEESTFMIVPDRLNNTFVIIRRDYNQISVLDRDGNLLFEQDHAVSEKIMAQYYRFSADHQIIIVTDMLQEFTYIYDEKGRLLNAQPISNSGSVALIYSETNDIHTLYYTFDQSFHIAQLK